MYSSAHSLETTELYWVLLLDHLLFVQYCSQKIN